MAKAFRLFARFKKGFSALYTRAEQGVDMPSREAALRLLRMVKGLHYGRLHSKWYESRQMEPPRPLNLGTLQLEARRRLGFAFAKTAAIAATLHRQGLIRNPHADGLVIGPATPDYLLAVVRTLPEAFREEKQIAADLLLAGAVPEVLFDQAATQSRSMLLPGFRPREARGFPSADETALHDLICRWFIAGFLPSHAVNRVALHWVIGGHCFTTIQDITAALGWAAILENLEFSNAGLDPTDVDERQPLNGFEVIEVGDDNPEGTLLFLGPCPLCGQGQVEARTDIYACSNRPRGCRFRLPKRKLDWRIGPEHARQLMEHGFTDVIQGMALANGRGSAARLKLVGDEVVLQPVWNGDHQFREAYGAEDSE